MRKLSFISIIVIVFTTSVFSQVPEKMSYQAVIRNASGELVISKQVGIRISILIGSPSGTAVFVEKHFANTNSNGLVSLEIGAGSPVSGTFSGIDWSSGVYFIKTETDLEGNTNYTISGTSQLLTVPFAMHAKSAENANWTFVSNKPTTLSGYGITDAINNSHPSYSITSTSISNWNLTYSWGNHVGLYRPISYVPAWNEITSKPTTLAGYGITDAINISHPAYTITATSISNWNLAYSWGNHIGLYRPISYVPSWNDITSKPTTLTGFGITDGVNTTGNQTIAGIKTFSGTIDANNKTIINIANPVNNQDAVTKSYVDNKQPWIIFQTSTQSVIGNNSPVINTATRNVFLGQSAGMNNVSGVYNTFIGSEAGYSNKIGTRNIAIGENALRENDEGGENIAIGSNALEKNKVSSPGSLGGQGFQNIGIGWDALRLATSNGNIGIGVQAMSQLITSGYNIGVGGHVMRDLVTGDRNVAIGYMSMISSTNASKNVFIGANSGEHAAGVGNVFLGYESGNLNSGTNNVFIGFLSGWGETWKNVDNRLIISNGLASQVDAPLIYGEFDNREIKLNASVNINDVLQLTPRAVAPVNPSEGDIYYNSTAHKLMVFDGSNWMACW